MKTEIHNYYHSLPEDTDRDMLCSLLEGNGASFGKKVSSHIGEHEVKVKFKDLLAALMTTDAFTNENKEFLTPSEVLEMFQCILLLEILYEEFTRKSGRRSFFIANYKGTNPERVFLAYQFVLLKANRIPERNLLALYNGLKQTDLGLISKWSKLERIKNFVKISRKNLIGYFQDGSFVGFKSRKKINDVEDTLQIIFDEISLLSDYFKKSGEYYHAHGEVPGVKSIPDVPPEIPKPQKAPVEKQLTPVQKSLLVLKLNVMPESQKELKKVFYQLAMAYHPDKFESQEKGTRTEIAIIDKFREIHNAYEVIEKEIERKKS